MSAPRKPTTIELEDSARAAQDRVRENKQADKKSAPLPPSRHTEDALQTARMQAEANATRILKDNKSARDPEAERIARLVNARKNPPLPPVVTSASAAKPAPSTTNKMASMLANNGSAPTKKSILVNQGSSMAANVEVRQAQKVEENININFTKKNIFLPLQKHLLDTIDDKNPDFLKCTELTQEVITKITELMKTTVSKNSNITLDNLSKELAVVSNDILYDPNKDFKHSENLSTFRDNLKDFIKENISNFHIVNDASKKDFSEKFSANLQSLAPEAPTLTAPAHKRS
jgi:hypothetical protein